MEVNEKNRRIFENARDHLNQADLKNTEQFDKAILSLSSAGLALSISFSKFIAPPDIAECIVLLKLSWLLFGLAIVSTILSFLASSSAINTAREHIFQYYMEGNDAYANRPNPGSIAAYWLNRMSALLFILGITTTVIYVNQNIHINEEHTVSNKNNSEQEQRGYVPPKNEPKPKPKPSSTDTGTGNRGSDQQQSNSKVDKK